MLAAARLLKERLPRLRLVVPVAPTIDRALLGDAAEVELVDGRAPEVLAKAEAPPPPPRPPPLETAPPPPPPGGPHPPARPPRGTRARPWARESPPPPTPRSRTP